MTHLFIIDPQNDFVSPEGALFVPQADDDVARLAALIDAASAGPLGDGTSFDRVTVTLDCHSSYSIFHPSFWRCQDGAPPAPYTVITCDDIRCGKFTPEDASLLYYVLTYTEALEAEGHYRLRVWPPHCLAATWGHCLPAALRTALDHWEATHPRGVRYVLKGLNPLTEHYSALRAEVPLPNDPSTDTFRSLVEHLNSADRIYMAGEALSHCVLFTLRDMVREIAPQKITLLSHYSSPVTGFSREACLREIGTLGINISDVEQLR
jgi:nicotinamidase-related amidase